MAKKKTPPKTNSMKTIITITLIILLLGSGASNASKENIKNACLEMGHTSVGFTGPSKRIDIMKSYGISVAMASVFNKLVVAESELRSTITEARSDYNVYSFPEVETCLNRVLDCEKQLSALVNGNFEFFDQMGADVKECTTINTP